MILRGWKCKREIQDCVSLYVLVYIYFSYISVYLSEMIGLNNKTKSCTGLLESRVFAVWVWCIYTITKLKSNQESHSIHIHSYTHMYFVFTLFFSRSINNLCTANKWGKRFSCRMKKNANDVRCGRVDWVNTIFIG